MQSRRLGPALEAEQGFSGRRLGLALDAEQEGFVEKAISSGTEIADF